MKEKAGRGEPSPERTLVANQDQFEQDYRPYYKGDLNRLNEDGSKTTVCAYELTIDPLNEVERDSLVTVFALRAAQAGYKQALGSIVLPGVGYREPAGRRPLTAIQFFFERPATSS